MEQKSFNMLMGIFFALIFSLHLIRIIFSWPAIIGSLTIPIWASWITLIISAYLSYSAFRLAR